MRMSEKCRNNNNNKHNNNNSDNSLTFRRTDGSKSQQLDVLVHFKQIFTSMTKL